MAKQIQKVYEVAMAKTNSRETLIIVTADHSQVFTIAGYPTRGSDILGLVAETQIVAIHRLMLRRIG